MQLEKPAKFKIYEGIICLETESPTGRKWWDWGLDLAYTPYKIADIKNIRVGKLQNSPRVIMAIQTPNGWVAMNPPRTDIFTLEKLGIWPQEIPYPYYTLEEYTPWPESL